MNELKIDVVGIEEGMFGKEIIVKMPRWRKARYCSVMEFEGNKIVLQGDKFIMMVDADTGEAIYNTKGSYFPHLSNLFGAKKGKVSQEFIEKIKSVMVKDGALMGVMPDGSMVIYKRGKLI